MYPAQFDYLRASSVEEALQLLGEHEDAKLIAGGHSLIPMMKLRLAQPATVIDIGRIDALKGVSVDGGSVRIGALTTHNAIAASSELAEHAALVAEAAGHIGDNQVRNRGTIGGNIAHADPGSDLPATLLATGATIHLQGPSGARTVASEDFFIDLLMTDLGEDEVVTAIEIPSLAAREGKTGSAYLKFEHPASGYAVVGAAAFVTVDDSGQCTGAGLALNGATAAPLDGSAVAAALVGSAPTDEAIDAAASSLVVDEPMGDLFASEEYRAHLAKVYAKRALKAARDRT